MNHDKTQQAWAEVVKTLEKRLARAKQIQAILDEDAELAGILIHAFQQSEAAPTEPPTPLQDHAAGRQATPPSRVTPNSSQTLHDRVVEYLTAQGNRPVSAPRLALEWKLHRGTLTNMLYGCLEDFETVPHPDGGKKKLWRLCRWPRTTAGDGASTIVQE